MNPEVTINITRKEAQTFLVVVSLDGRKVEYREITVRHDYEILDRLAVLLKMTYGVNSVIK